MIYDEDSARQLFMEAKSVYEDRGMMKWMTSFILPEHSKALNNFKEEREKIINQKPQMDGSEIERILETARLKSNPVSIQLEILNRDGNYGDDVNGMIRGFDELGIYIDDQKVHYDEIRNVELYNRPKWSKFK